VPPPHDQSPTVPAATRWRERSSAQACQSRGWRSSAGQTFAHARTAPGSTAVFTRIRYQRPGSGSTPVSTCPAVKAVPWLTSAKLPGMPRTGSARRRRIMRSSPSG
jgi:hypothetical protein